MMMMMFKVMGPEENRKGMTCKLQTQSAMCNVHITSYSQPGYIAVHLLSLLSLLLLVMLCITAQIFKKTISPLETVLRAALYTDLIHLSTKLIHVRNFLITEILCF